MTGIYWLHMVDHLRNRYCNVIATMLGNPTVENRVASWQRGHPIFSFSQQFTNFFGIQAGITRG